MILFRNKKKKRTFITSIFLFKNLWETGNCTQTVTTPESYVYQANGIGCKSTPEFDGQSSFSSNKYMIHYIWYPIFKYPKSNRKWAVFKLAGFFHSVRICSGSLRISNLLDSITPQEHESTTIYRLYHYMICRYYTSGYNSNKKGPLATVLQCKQAD